MKKGQQRFEYYLNQLQELLVKSAKQKNPALWLYQNNARTPLFMLEALSELYGSMHNKKKFGKLKEQFKLLEDTIGGIDYYDSYAKEFVGNKKIPAAITSYLQAQSREKIQSLNEILKEKKWLSEEKTRVEKIKKKLKKADWQNEKDDVKSIHQFYITAIHEILEFINKTDFHFVDVENDVHELRRKIRWLSIYPQALLGCIQLSKPKTKAPDFLAKYLTKAITGSKYNIMPDAADQKQFLLFDQNRFYALSWMIAELGTLKDNGLKVEAVKEAILQTSPQGPAGKTNEKAALAKANKLVGSKQISIEQVLAVAQDITKTFCREKNLESLIIGTAAVNK